MSNIKTRKRIYRYKRKVRFLYFLFASIIFILLGLFSQKIIVGFNVLKNFRSVVETKIPKLSEEMDFDNGSFFLKLEKNGKFIDIKAEIEKNITSEIDFTGKKPYQMEGFYAKATRFKKEVQNPEDVFVLTSKYAYFKEKAFIIKTNVEGEYTSKINPQLDGTLLFADEITFFKSLDVSGENLFIKSKEGILKAKSFFVKGKFDSLQLSLGVMLENKDYKIISQNLDAYLINGEPENIIFTGNVIFTQKNNEQTTVYGKKAIYNNIKSEITILGNVKAISKKNSFSSSGDSFHYNTITKSGFLKGNKKSNKKIEIELEV